MSRIEFEFPQGQCRFGIARRDVTPPVGIYHRMWGAAAHDRSEGEHRRLTATAIVFAPLEAAPADRDVSAGNQRQVVVAIDHCLLFHREMQQLLDRICAATSIARDDLLVAFSHTHAAGLMEERRAGLPGGELIAPYLERLAADVSSAIAEALASLQPAGIAWATGRCSLAANRDFLDEAGGQFVCGFNPGAPADDTLLSARITDASGRIVATLVNYACHPTTLAWDNRLISPDFVGAMREVVERETNAPCVFLQGASGDLGPREGFVGDVEVADRNGRQLGFAALAVLDSLGPPHTKMQYAGPVVSGATIGTWRNVTLTETELAAKRRWRRDGWTIDLPYRTGLPTAEATRRELEEWRSKERAAREAGDPAAAAEARAMAERKNRQMTRLDALPPGERFPYPVRHWQTGDGHWLAVEGEPYNLLQRSLRERFAGTPIVVMTLANGSRVGYLPTAATYGKGIYQESIAVLERGCLEMLIDAIGQRIGL